MEPINDWNEYKQLFLAELIDSKEFRKEVRSLLNQLESDISGLKVKATVAGGLAGIVGTGIVTVIIRMIVH